MLKQQLQHQKTQKIQTNNNKTTTTTTTTHHPNQLNVPPLFRIQQSSPSQSKKTKQKKQKNKKQEQKLPSLFNKNEEQTTISLSTPLHSFPPLFFSQCTYPQKMTWSRSVLVFSFPKTIWK